MKRSLNLDSQFVPVPMPEIDFDLFQFSGGEWHIKLGAGITYSRISHVIITHRVRSMDDLMKIMIAKDALERKGVKKFDLVMPYIPYARQDRQCAGRESFTLKVFTDLLNSANFNRVLVLDPHSDVSTALINNCRVADTYRYIQQAVDSIKDGVLLISPDAGSNKKALGVMQNVIGFERLIKCDKTRDVETGNLSGFEVYSGNLDGQDCLIVDDICDGGGTFIGLAKELKEKGAGDLFLYVTHGIFSKGFAYLTPHFRKVFCTDSFKTIDPVHRIKQFNIAL